MTEQPEKLGPIYRFVTSGKPPDWVKDELTPRKPTQDAIDRLKLETDAIK